MRTTREERERYLKEEKGLASHELLRVNLLNIRNAVIVVIDLVILYKTKRIKTKLSKGGGRGR
jgi:hypothetical protein